jgi:uncharacterized protein (TIGR00661 family)
MKIFYAVQATGNGHISRAMELLPHLQQYGTVDIFLSGDNSNLPMDAPVKYRSKGLSLYSNSCGGLDYWKIIRGINPLRINKEINDLPVEKYDLVINDFEFITSAACARKKIASIQLGHQASFQSRLTPRPGSKNAMGEWILKNYAKATDYIGLHFDKYDGFILPPVIKKDILDAEPVDKGHITVYLPSYSGAVLEKIFQPFGETQFHIFSKENKQPVKKGNIIFMPVNKTLFNQSLIECNGIVTGAGFETPAEALHLGKKLLAIPTRGQYEQQCNAAALEKMGVTCLKKIDGKFRAVFHQWLETKNVCTVNYRQTIPQVLENLFTLYETSKRKCNNNNPSDISINLQELLTPYISGQF